MTMLNAWIANGAGHLMTDAASYDDTGMILGLGPKLITFPGWRGVVATLGRAATCRAEYALKTLDGLTESNLGSMLPAAVRAIYDENDRDDPSRANDLAMVAVVWSDSLNAPVMWQCGTGGRCLMPGLQPFVAYRGTSGVGVVHPYLDDWSGYEWATLDPEADGAGLAEAQRRVQLVTPHNPVDFPVVGGFVDCATVTADGVNLRRIVEWPTDIVGSRIAA